MKQIYFNEANRKYYSEDFIKGFECGTERQYKADQKTGHWKKMVSVYDMIEGKYRMIPYTHQDEKLNNPPFYVCDCGNNSKKPTNYCPDCGAKMEVKNK